MNTNNTWHDLLTKAGGTPPVPVNPIYAAIDPDPNRTWRYVSRKDTATLVRLALKRAYPRTKFGVRMTPGYSIDVRYDGSAAGAPRKSDVVSLLAPYEGGGFDGMIDMSYKMKSWLLPDGSVALGESAGTYGSGGSVPGFKYAPPSDAALLVTLGNDYIFVTDRGL